MKMDSKGISALIAVVMLLMITVALVGMAYMWVTTAFSGVTKETGESIEQGTQVIATKFVINSAAYDSGSNTVNVSIQNIGTTEINLDNADVILGGFSQNVIYKSQATLKPQERALVAFTNSTDACGREVTVKYLGVEASAEVYCG